MATVAPSAPPLRPVIAPSVFRRHLNLTRELAVTQFKLKYTGSLLGYLWSAFKPLMYFGIMYVVFVYIFHAGGASPEFPLQLLTAIVFFTFFQEATGAAVGAIAGNGHMIRKAYFPRSILVVASSLTATITFTINFALIVLVAAPLGHVHLGLRSVMVIPLAVELYLLCLGVGLLLSSVFVFYRDVGHIWEIVTQLLFYASMVVFPLAIVPGKHLPTLLMLNPIGQIIEDMRRAVVIDDPRVPWSISVLGVAEVIPVALVALSLVVGGWTFHRLTPKFAENL